jgi:hypothetical protein
MNAEPKAPDLNGDTLRNHFATLRPILDADASEVTNAEAA